MNSIGYWFILKGGGDELRITRHALNTVAPIKDIFKGMNTNDMASFLSNVKQAAENRSLDLMLSSLVTAQVDLIAKRCEPEQLNFARGTLNGISLVRQEMDRLALRLKEDREPFNPHEII